MIYSLSFSLATNRTELFQYQFHYMIAGCNNLYQSRKMCYLGQSIRDCHMDINQMCLIKKLLTAANINTLKVSEHKQKPTEIKAVHISLALQAQGPLPLCRLKPRLNQQEDTGELFVPMLFMLFQISMYLTWLLPYTPYRNNCSQSFIPLFREQIMKDFTRYSTILPANSGKL